MARAVLALGANLEEPALQIDRAISALCNHPQITLLAKSTIIVSAPWGKTDQPSFHNGAILVETSLSPSALLEFCLGTEHAIGRVRKERWGPRLIDIDVIAYDQLVMASDQLTLPHPHAHEREFVLEPVREIAPEIAQWLVNRTIEKSA